MPSGLFGGKDEAGKANELQANAQAARLQNTHISPREPEEWTNYLDDVSKQIYPILEWHDEIMQSITETIENIPILPTLIEQLQGKDQSLSWDSSADFDRTTKHLCVWSSCSFCLAHYQSGQGRA